jgi:uncharacterized protein (TIGR02246 family)
MKTGLRQATTSANSRSDQRRTITDMDSIDVVRAALDEFDRRFASGDASALTKTFTTDARLLLLHREPIEGRHAILSHWTRVFGEYDPGAWRTEPRTVEVHGDYAYALSDYSETLVSRSSGPSLRVLGRLVFFMRRDPDGHWLMATVLNSHVRPVEQVPAGEGA